MDSNGKPIRIAINAVLAYEQPRGVGNYLNALLPAIARIDSVNEYNIYYGRWMGNYGFTKIKQDNFKLIELDIDNNQIKRNIFLSVKLPKMVRKLGADVYWVPDSQATLFKPCRMISTIHDLAEYVVPEKYSPRTAMIRRIYVKHQVRLSDHIITVSGYSKQDICQRFGVPDDSVSVVYNALANNNDYISEEVPDDYILYVSEIEKAKNLAVLIDAYAMLDEKIRDKYELRVVGKKGNCYEDILNRVRAKGIEDRVRFYGYLSNEELEEMYRKAYVFVFPSLFEGFGYPVLEAMSKGIPVICSSASSIPEVGGDAVLQFDPHDADGLATHLKKIIEDDSVRPALIKKGTDRSRMFTIDKMSKETLTVLTEK